MEQPQVQLHPGSLRARRVARTAWRTVLALLLGLAAVLGAVLLARNGLVPLVDATLHPGPAGLSAIRRGGIFAGALAGYWAYVRWHEQRPAGELLLPPRALPAGIGGLLMIGLPIALLFASGAYALVQVRAPTSALWGVAALIVIAATLEELVYRALLFRVLERACGTAVALLLQALVFAAQHMENLAQGSGADIAAMLVSVAVLGMLWGGLFVLTRNLWVSVAHHAGWNFGIVLSGVPLSGIEDWRALAPLESRYAGPDWLTGGLFGPESSLLVIATTSLATLLLLRAARRRDCFRTAQAL